MKPSRPTDRRKEPRHEVSGPVSLRPINVLAGGFNGCLLDVSATGFRCVHSCMAISSGHEVTFTFAGQSGTARAVWTRIADGQAETGFQILAIESVPKSASRLR